MRTPLEILFDGMQPSEFAEQDIRERVQKLEQFSDKITRCRVSVAAKHRHQQQGRLYHVNIHLHVPGKELVVSQDRHDKHAHEELHVALRDSFSAMTRQLQDYERKIRGDVKSHDLPPHGFVEHVDLEKHHGFIRSSDGRRIYFHENSVIDGSFDQLEAGSEVRFAESEGNDGPQASSVHLVGKHHVVG